MFFKINPKSCEIPIWATFVRKVLTKANLVTLEASDIIDFELMICDFRVLSLPEQVWSVQVFYGILPFRILLFFKTRTVDPYQAWNSLEEGDEQPDWPNSQTFLLWNVAMSMLHNFFICHEYKSLPFGLIRAFITLYSRAPSIWVWLFINFGKMQSLDLNTISAHSVNSFLRNRSTE